MLKVVEAGFFTTVQDAGRFGYRNLGVPVSGTMDAKSARIANSLLENDKEDALLEITMTGPTLKFGEPTFISISGADMSASINGEKLNNNEVYRVDSGDVLSYGKLGSGFRSYLAVKGGFKTQEVLNSRSYYKSLTNISQIKAEDEIPYEANPDYIPKITHIKTGSSFKDHNIQVFPGPEFDRLGNACREQLFNTTFTIAKEYNRMAYQLEERLDAERIPMITSANLPGTVQLTPAGRLIVLMRDGQTTGGYPRILQLNEASISLLSQKRFGEQISFELL